MRRKNSVMFAPDLRDQLVKVPLAGVGGGGPSVHIGPDKPLRSVLHSQQLTC